MNDHLTLSPATVTASSPRAIIEQEYNKNTQKEVTGITDQSTEAQDGRDPNSLAFTTVAQELDRQKRLGQEALGGESLEGKPVLQAPLVQKARL